MKDVEHRRSYRIACMSRRFHLHAFVLVRGSMDAFVEALSYLLHSSNPLRAVCRKPPPIALMDGAHGSSHKLLLPTVTKQPSC
eukprot:6386322-Amphidinium_carterae.1